MISAQVSLLDTNNILMNARVNGDIGKEYDSSNLFYAASKAPYNASTTFLWSSSLWMGGIEGEANLHLAGNTYSQNGDDFWYGPVASGYDTVYDATYNRTWIITNSQIESHITNYAEPNYVLPEVIENWPTHGNIDNGEAQNLAPFKDVNNNGEYEPMLGDHPIIRGDKAVFVIYNDDRLANVSTNANKIGVEVHLMMYGYDSNDEDLDNAIFMNYRIFNRGDLNLSDFKIGKFVDWDLGHYNDDYVGCDVDRNLSFVYNGDATDEGTYGYGDNPPAAGLVLLNESMDAHISFQNGTHPTLGFPVIPTGYYNYLSGKYLYGTDYLVDTIVSTYMFPGTTDPSMPSLDLDENYFNNNPSDRRSVQATHHGSFDIGASICLDYAFVFANDVTNTNLENLDFLKERVDSIQDFYDSHFEGCLDYIVDIENLDLEDFIAATGLDCSYLESSNGWKLSLLDAENYNVQVQLTNVQGQLIRKLNWQTTEDLILQKNGIENGVYFVTVLKGGTSYSTQIVFK